MLGPVFSSTARTAAIPDNESAAPGVNSMQPDSKPCVVDFSSAIAVAMENEMGTSANLGKVVSFKGEHFYLKDAVSFLPISPEMGNAITSREVASARLYGLFLLAPEELMVNQCSSIMEGADNEKTFIASRLVDYQDLGDCLTKGRLADDLKLQFQAFTAEQADTFKNNADTAQKLTDELSALRNQHSDYRNQPWWAGKNANPHIALVDAYRPKAQALDEVMHAQIHLLPEALQQEMQEHLAVSQLLGDWDPINAFYKNMGIVKTDDGSLRVMRLDFGSCLDIGFQGQTKENGYETAVNQRPAVFPELEHVFKMENAEFSEALPRLVEDLCALPYADHAQSIAGKPEWADTTRMKIGYRCSLIMQQKDFAQDAVETIIKNNLMEAPSLKPADELIRILHARMDALINEQCGGSNNLVTWEIDNPTLSDAIRTDLSTRLSIPIAPLSYDPNKHLSDSLRQKLNTQNN